MKKNIKNSALGSGGVVVKVGSIRYKETPVSSADGSTLEMQGDQYGNLKTTLATQLAGEDITADVLRITEAGTISSYISTATTTLCMTGRGYIVGLDLTETAAGTITIYDSLTAAGTVLAVLKASIVEGTYLKGLPFFTGCTVVTAGASKLTVILSR